MVKDNGFVYNMSKHWQKCSSQFSGAQTDVFKLRLLSKQQSKVIYCNELQRKAANLTSIDILSIT